MRIYIHTDLEGISGIDCVEMMARNNERYLESRQNLMGDLNAAVEGAFAGGADHVTVLDSHGGGGNFVLEMLDPRAENDTKPTGKWWGIMDESYDGSFFIGAHAMAGTMNGFLDHTQCSRSCYSYAVNGRQMGELGQWAMVAGHFGIPMLMVAGDERACVEAHEFFQPVETASVKRGVGRNHADLVELSEARDRIRDAAQRAISLVGEARPFVPVKPMEMILEVTRADYADGADRQADVERIGARTTRRVTSCALDLFF
ncbi:MAG TPA: M55 family metallopeptidase [Armatimonadota bacterium]|nr:M55 family metallopeptidase [Armatimonadota bacterium]